MFDNRRYSISVGYSVSETRYLEASQRVFGMLTQRQLEFSAHPLGFIPNNDLQAVRVTVGCGAVDKSYSPLDGGELGIANLDSALDELVKKLSPSETSPEQRRQV